MADRTVAVHLKAITDQYRRAMDQAADATQRLVDRAGGLENLGSRMQSVGGMMTRSVTMPLVLAGGAATKLSLDFEKSFATMVGLAGVAAEDVDGLRDSVLNLAGETGRAPQELANALYMAASAGLETRQAMEAVDVAAHAAAAGLGRTEDVVGLVASAIASYGEEAVNAAEATDILTATIRAGRADPDELASTLGRVLPIAAQLGVSFEEVGGTVAYLSNVFGDTNRTVTAVSGLLVKLVSPSKQGRDALEEMGTSAEALQAAIDRDGLLGALELLRDKGFAGNNQALRALFDDIEGYQAALALLNDRSGTLSQTLGEVADSSGALDNAFGTMAETAGFKNSQAFAELQVALVRIGDALVPIVGALAEFAAGFIEAFTSLPGPIQTAVIAFGGLLAATGPLLSIGGKLAQNWQSLSRGLDTIAVGAYDAAGNIGKFGKALAGIGTAIAVIEIARRTTQTMGDTIDEMKEKAGDTEDAYSQLRASIQADTGAINENTEAHIANRLEQLGLLSVLADAGVTWDQYMEAIRGAVDAGGDRDAALAATGEVADKVAAKFGATSDEFLELSAANGVLIGQLGRAQGAMEDVETTGAPTGEAIEDVGSSMLDMADDAVTAEQAIQGLVDAFLGTFDPFFAMQDALDGLEQAHDAVRDAQDAAADASRNVGDVQRQVAQDIASAQQDVIDSAQAVEEAQLGVAEAMSIVADEAAAARQGIADLASEQQAAIDPLFAMVEAVQRLEDLKNQGRSTVKGTKTGKDSGKLESQEGEAPTALEIAQAAAGVQQAATRLAGAIATGDVSLAESQQTLALWVKQGLLTQDAAGEVARAFQLAADRAEGLQGANVRNAASTAVVEERQRAAEERAEAVAEAQKRLQDAMRQSATAQDRLARAHEDGARKIVEAQERAAEAHEDVAEAQEKVVRASVDVMAASIALAGTMATNRAAVDLAKRSIEQLGERMGWSKAQIQAAKDEIDRAAEAARAFAQPWVATMDLDTRAFWMKYAELKFKMAEDQIAAQIANPHLRSPGVPVYNNASGGPIPGPRGAPVYGIAHGGEFVLSADVVDAIKHGRPTAGLGGSYGGRGMTDARTVNVTNIYPKPETGSDGVGRTVRKAQLAFA